jgi:two-component system sensor histidine kinase YesM
LWNLERGEYVQNNWYKDYTAHGIHWTTAHFDPRQTDSFMKNINVVSLLFPLTKLQSLKTEGIIKMNIKTSLFQNPLDKLQLGESGRFYLLNENGETVLAQNQIALPEEIMMNIRRVANSEHPGTTRIRDLDTGHLYFLQKAEATGWVLLGEVSEDELYHKITLVRRTVIFVAMLLLGLMVVMTFWFSSGIARPLSQVVRSMKFVEHGNFLKASVIMAGVKTNQNEIGELIANYKLMVSRLQEYIKTEFTLNMRRRNAEYKALLLQINPHFLNNTLEVISSLAAQRRHGDIQQVINHLSKMLSYTLRVDSDLIKLRDEKRANCAASRR